MILMAKELKPTVRKSSSRDFVVYAGYNLYLNRKRTGLTEKVGAAYFCCEQSAAAICQNMAAKEPKFDWQSKKVRRDDPL
jgi:hypothetical protein